MKESIVKSAKALWKSFPFILGVILLISLVTSLIDKSFYTRIFTQNIFADLFIGSLVGGISAGNPMVSYVLGGELLKQGVGLIAVTAFLVFWITIGIIQLPAESTMLGRKFAILRNIKFKEGSGKIKEII